MSRRRKLTPSLQTLVVTTAPNVRKIPSKRIALNALFAPLTQGYGAN